MHNIVCSELCEVFISCKLRSLVESDASSNLPSVVCNSVNYLSVYLFMCLVLYHVNKMTKTSLLSGNFSPIGCAS